MSLEKTPGEVTAIVGYFFQYEIFATEIYNHLLTNQLEWVEFASQEAGKLDDVLIGTKDAIIAYQTKQIGSSNFSYREFTNADPESIFQGVFKGWKKISDAYPGKKIDARFITTQNVSEDDSISGHARPYRPSFEKFVRNFWKPIQRGTYDSQSIPAVWQTVFDELVASVNSTADEFIVFVKDFNFVFNYQQNHFFFDNYTQAKRITHIESITKSIARLISKKGTVHLKRSQFLIDFGLRDQVETRFRHAFFVDDLHYQSIQGTINELDSIIQQKRKGYIALIGNAGSGKSTLLTKWLDRDDSRVFKYYAYTNIEMSYDSGYRGEASFFLHDLLVQFREKEITLQDRLPDSDLLDLQRHLAIELNKLSNDNQKIFIIVDGLDHIDREQSVTKSLITVLPHPDSIPDNIYFILGSRTVTQLTELGFDIQHHLEQTQSIVTISPLTKAQIDALLTSYQIDLSDELLDKLLEHTSGHPLFLRYTIEEVRQANEAEYKGIIESKQFTGDIYAEYAKFWRAHKNFDEFAHILGIISRFRFPYFNLDLLSNFKISGNDADRVNKLSEFYFYKSGNIWQFFHNSFKEFLIEESAKNKISGKFEPKIDKKFHAEIADAIKEAEGFYRYNTIYHLYKAGNFKEVTNLVSQEYFRQQWFAFRNNELIGEDIRLAANSGFNERDLQTIAICFFSFMELDQRVKNFTQSDYPDLFLAAGWLDIASSFIFDSARILVNKSAALNFAMMLYDEGRVDLAKELFDRASPTKFLTKAGKLNSRRYHQQTYAETDEVALMKKWAEVASLFIPVGEVIECLNELVIEAEGQGEPDTPFLPEAFFALKDLFIERNQEQKLRELIALMPMHLDNEDQFDIFFNILSDDIESADLKGAAISFFNNWPINDSDHRKLAYTLVYVFFEPDPAKSLPIFQSLETPAELKQRIKPHTESALANYIFNYTRLYYILNKDFNVDTNIFVPHSDKPVVNAFNTAFADLGKANAWFYHGYKESSGTFFKRIDRLFAMFHHTFLDGMYDTDISSAKGVLMEQVLRGSFKIGTELTNQVLEALSEEWKKNKRYWGSSVIQGIISWVIDNKLNEDWCKQMLKDIEGTIYEEGDLRQRIENGVYQARLWAKFSDKSKVEANIDKLMSICLNMAPEDDIQVDRMVKWIAKGSNDQSGDLQYYLDRLPSIFQKVNSALSTPAELVFRLSLEHGNGFLIFKHLLFDYLMPVLDGVEIILKYLLPKMRNLGDVFLKLFSSIIIAMDDAHTVRRLFIREFFKINPSIEEITLLVKEIKIYAMAEVRQNYLLEVQDLLGKTNISSEAVGIGDKIILKDSDRNSSETLRLKDGRSLNENEVLARIESLDDLKLLKDQEESHGYFNWTIAIIKIIPAAKTDELRSVLKELKLDIDTKHLLNIAQTLIDNQQKDLAIDLLSRTIKESKYSQWGDNYYAAGKIPAYQLLATLQPSVVTGGTAFKDFVDELPEMNVQAKASLIDKLTDVFDLFGFPQSIEMLNGEIINYRNQLFTNDKPRSEIPIIGNEGDQCLFIKMLFFLITMPSHFDEIIYPILIKDRERLRGVIDALLTMMIDNYFTIKFLHLLTTLSDEDQNYIHQYREQLISLLNSDRLDINQLAADLLYLIDDHSLRDERTGELSLSYTLTFEPRSTIVTPQEKPIDNISNDGYLKDTEDPITYCKVISGEIKILSRLTGFAEYNIAYRIHLLGTDLQFPDWCRSIGEKELRKIYESKLKLKIPYNRPRVQLVFDGLAKVMMELIDLQYLDIDDALMLLPYFDSNLYKIKVSEQPDFIASILKTSGSAPSVDRKWAHELTDEYVSGVLRLHAHDKYIIAERTVIQGMGHGKAMETREAFVDLLMTPPQNDWSFFKFKKQMHIADYQYVQSHGITLFNSALSTTHEAGWLAINPLVAIDLDLTLDEANGNFRWIDANGNIVVESIFWHLGNPANKNGHHNSEAGCGWVVTITKEGMNAILKILGDRPLYHYKKIIRNLEFVQERYGTYIDEEDNKVVRDNFVLYLD
jgi:hypothetical protein